MIWLVNKRKYPRHRSSAGIRYCSSALRSSRLMPFLFFGTAAIIARILATSIDDCASEISFEISCRSAASAARASASSACPAKITSIAGAAVPRSLSNVSASDGQTSRMPRTACRGDITIPAKSPSKSPEAPKPLLVPSRMREIATGSAVSHVVQAHNERTVANTIKGIIAIATCGSSTGTSLKS